MTLLLNLLLTVLFLLTLFLTAFLLLTLLLTALFLLTLLLTLLLAALLLLPPFLTTMLILFLMSHQGLLTHVLQLFCRLFATFGHVSCRPQMIVHLRVLSRCCDAAY